MSVSPSLFVCLCLLISSVSARLRVSFCLSVRLSLRMRLTLHIAHCVCLSLYLSPHLEIVVQHFLAMPTLEGKLSLLLDVGGIAGLPTVVILVDRKPVSLPRRLRVFRLSGFGG